MKEKGMITMNEFKSVVEHFDSKLSKVIEVMHHRFNKMEARIEKNEKELKKTNDVMTREFKKAHNERSAIREQVALLHEGQTAIRSDMHEKASYREVKELQKRVTRLENKLAS